MRKTIVVVVFFTAVGLAAGWFFSPADSTEVPPQPHQSTAVNSPGEGHLHTGPMTSGGVPITDTAFEEVQAEMHQKGVQAVDKLAIDQQVNAFDGEPADALVANPTAYLEKIPEFCAATKTSFCSEGENLLAKLLFMDVAACMILGPDGKALGLLPGSQLWDPTQESAVQLHITMAAMQSSAQAPAVWKELSLENSGVFVFDAGADVPEALKKNISIENVRDKLNPNAPVIGLQFNRVNAIGDVGMTVFLFQYIDDDFTFIRGWDTVQTMAKGMTHPGLTDNPDITQTQK